MQAELNMMAFALLSLVSKFSIKHVALPFMIIRARPYRISNHGIGACSNGYYNGSLAVCLFVYLSVCLRPAVHRPAIKTPVYFNKNNQ